MKLSRDSGQNNFRWNYSCAILNGVFYNAANAFIGGSTVLPLFVSTLTSSKFMVGLISTMEGATWPLPQVFVASLIEHKERKKPLYIYMAILRSLIILIIGLFIIFFYGATPKYGFLTLFILLFFTYSIAGGVSGISFMDIVGKSFPSNRRGSLWGWRMGIGGSLGVIFGFVVRFIIKNINYPINFGVLFLIATFFISIALLSFSLIKEPVSNTVTKERKTFHTFLSEGLKTLRQDKRFKNLFFSRISFGINAMSIPFYIIFIKQHHNIPLNNVGFFVSAQISGSIISNLLWGGLSNYKGNHLVLRLAALVTALPPILVFTSYLFNPNLIFDLSIFFLLGFGIQGIWVGFPNALLDISPENKRPTYVGFMNTMIAPVLFLPTVGGLIIDYVSFNSLFVLSLLASISAFIFATKFKP